MRASMLGIGAFGAGDEVRGERQVRLLGLDLEEEDDEGRLTRSV